MGQGAWTALAQIAADALGLDPDRFEFRSGTSDLPDAGIAGGSAHTATAGTAIHNAGARRDCQAGGTGDERPALAAVRRRQCRRDRAEAAGCTAATTRAGARAMPTSCVRAGLAEIEGRGSGASDPAAQSAYAMYAHGAVFAEVKVDPGFWPGPRHPAGRRVRRRHASSIRGWCAANITAA